MVELVVVVVVVVVRYVDGLKEVVGWVVGRGVVVVVVVVVVVLVVDFSVDVVKVAGST